MSLTQNIQHIIFSTRNRRPTIIETHARELYSYIYSLLITKKCFVYRIGGMPDHVHILVDVHPTIAVSDLVRDIKMATAKWLRANPMFPNFEGWNNRYASLSRSYGDLPTITNYIKNQREHHCGISYEQEHRLLIADSGLKWHENEI